MAHPHPPPSEASRGRLDPSLLLGQNFPEIALSLGILKELGLRRADLEKKKRRAWGGHTFEHPLPHSPPRGSWESLYIHKDRILKSRSIIPLLHL